MSMYLADEGATEALAMLAQVAHLGTVLGWTVERSLADLVVRDRDAEPGAELTQLLLVQLLLLMRDVFRER